MCCLICVHLSLGAAPSGAYILGNALMPVLQPLHVHTKVALKYRFICPESLFITGKNTYIKTHDSESRGQEEAAVHDE